MPFDISTAKPVEGGFDISTAKPVEEAGAKSRLKPAREFNKIDRIANYFMPQALSEQEYQPGEKNIFGDIQHALSRPGGAVRSAIMPKVRNSFEADIAPGSR